MKYYIAVAMDVDLHGSTLSALDITKTLLEKGFWAFSSSAPVKQNLVLGDMILFYIGGKNRHYFVAQAQIESTVSDASDEQKVVLNTLGIAFFNKTISIGDAEWFHLPVGIIPLKDRLSFISDKQNYGLSLRLPLREISKEDYLLIISNRNKSP